MIFKKISPKVHLDARGSLFEVYSESAKYNFKARHIYISESKCGTVRGFHQQLNLPQKKIVQCISGSVADFGMNIDPLSKDFGMVKKHHLNSGEGVLIDNKTAHAFECLSDNCTLLYICDQGYDPSGQININPLSEDFKHLWTSKKLELSPKDLHGMTLDEAKQVLLNKK